jgi:hypothetical protein
MEPSHVHMLTKLAPRGLASKYTPISNNVPDLAKENGKQWKIFADKSLVEVSRAGLHVRRPLTQQYAWNLLGKK